MTDNVKPWNRLLSASESGPAHHAFQHYRLLNVRVRSLARAYTICRVGCPKRKDFRAVPVTPEKLPDRLLEPTCNWKKWKRQYDWVNRAAAYDRQLDEDERLDRLEDVKKMNKRHTSLAVAVENKLVERLQTFDASDIKSAKEIAYVMDLAVGIERVARGEAASIVKQLLAGSVGTTATSDLRKLTDDELDQYERLMSKMAESADGPRNE